MAFGKKFKRLFSKALPIIGAGISLIGTGGASAPGILQGFLERKGGRAGGEEARQQLPANRFEPAEIEERRQAARTPAAASTESFPFNIEFLGIGRFLKSIFG